jgi:hypothetical protein
LIWFGNEGTENIFFLVVSEKEKEKEKVSLFSLKLFL